MGYNGQKVKVTILEKFCFSLLAKQIVLKEGKTKKVNLDRHNTALVNLLAGRGGEEVIAYITDDGQLAVNGDAYGFDDYIMVNFDFIDKKNIMSVNANYFEGCLYRMQDQDDALGFFVGAEFDFDSKSMLYSIMTTDKGLIKGADMIELGEEALDMYRLGERFKYYKLATPEENNDDE